MSRSHALGLSLLELLIAGSIMTSILTVLAMLFVSATRSYEGLERLSDHYQKEGIAVYLLRHDISLAGYQGATWADNALDMQASVEITKQAKASDRIVIRYLEDRIIEMPEGDDLPWVAVEYLADKVAGIHNLYRCESGCYGGHKQPAVEGVKGLVAESFILQDGETIPITPGPLPAKASCRQCLAAIRLRLIFEHGKEQTITIALVNEQHVVVN